MSGLEEPQSAEFHVWDLAAAQFDLETVAVVSGAEQDRLILQRHAQLPHLENPITDPVGLCRLIGAGDQRGTRP